MKSRTWSRAAMAVTAVCFISVGVSPAAAQTASEQTKGEAPPASPPRSLETVDEDGEKVPPVPAPLLEKLQDSGLEGEVTSIQKGTGGGVFYGGEDGTWVINMAPDAPSDPTTLNSPQAVSAAFGYGICTGYFNDIQKVANYLQWGGQSSCTASNNQFYLHEIEAELYDTCVGDPCIFLGYITTVYSPVSSRYSRVATAVGNNYCADRSAGADRTYEQKITVTVRSVEYGPFWQRDRVIDDCDVSPG